MMKGEHEGVVLEGVKISLLDPLLQKGEFRLQFLDLFGFLWIFLVLLIGLFLLFLFFILSEYNSTFDLESLLQPGVPRLLNLLPPPPLSLVSHRLLLLHLGN